MPRLKVNHLLKNFLADIASAEALVGQVRSLSNINPHGHQRSLHIKQVYRVVELAFIGIVSEWESFVEHTFIRYLAGAKSVIGYAAAVSVGQSKEHDPQL